MEYLFFPLKTTVGGEYFYYSCLRDDTLNHTPRVPSEWMEEPGSVQMVWLNILLWTIMLPCHCPTEMSNDARGTGVCGHFCRTGNYAAFVIMLRKLFLTSRLYVFYFLLQISLFYFLNENFIYLNSFWFKIWGRMHFLFPPMLKLFINT